VNTEFLWNEKTKQIIKDRMGVGEEYTDDDGDDGEGDIVGEGKILDNEDNDDDDDDNKNEGDNNNEEVHLKRRSDRRKKK